MVKLNFSIFFLLVVILQACDSREPVSIVKSNPEIMLGDDLLLGSHLDLIRGKHIAVVANKASVLSNGVALVDTLLKIDDVIISTIFTPEHGYNIGVPAGTMVSDSTSGNLHFYSLYGKNKKPTPEKLSNTDLILYDLQDLGTRFYTYISTLYYVMQAAGENNIPIIVLDRPDPVGGYRTEGPVLDPDFQSFVGIAPIPVIYGMTAGELAQFYLGQGMFSAKPDLKVIKMKNWKRTDFFSDYELEWISPSPNIPDFETALIYPATAFLEGTNISEGRGTDKPFKQIGAPFINSTELIKEINYFKQDGISLNPVSFIPESLPGKAEHPKYQGIRCNGIELKIDNPSGFEPVRFSISLLYSIHKLYPEKFKFIPAVFDGLMGEKYTREMLTTNGTPAEIINSWKTELNKFLEIRNKYLLY